MENKQKGQSAQEQDDHNKNAKNVKDARNEQPKESQAPSDRLSDYPDGNTQEINTQAQSIPGNQTDQPFTEGKTIAEATDPSKLSDL